jgi:hypothetical protein
MFPRRSYRTALDALLEIAEAMLRPADEQLAETGRGAVAVEHPHDRVARVERIRRPGGVAARSHSCLTPLGDRARPAARPTAPTR